MKVDGSLKSLLQGVSQQPMRDRLPGQCTDMLNMTADPISGLARRSPSDLVKVLYQTSGTPKFFNFETKNGSRFIASVDGTAMTVFDLNGTQKVVNNANQNYFLSVGLKAQALNNDLYIVNPEAVPRMRPNVMQYLNTENECFGIVSVLGGAYGRNYSLTVDGVLVATYVTPNGGTAADIVQASPSWIMAQLIQQIQAKPQFRNISSDGGSTFVFSRAGKFVISSTDDAGGTNMLAATDYVTSLDKLPAKAQSGYLMRVSSKADPLKDSYYQFVASNINGVSAGYWRETVAPGIPYIIDSASMPHKMTYDPDTDQFTVRESNWDNRDTGTELSNPVPSFIGNPINDVSSFQSRLVLLAGSSVNLSATNRSGQFFFSSATALADSDPIDISSTAVQGALITATPFNKDLVIMSEKGQFVLFGRTALTSKNAALVLTTNFEASLNARPIATGRNIFFANRYGRYSGIREFYADGQSDVNDSRAVTQHVKQLIQGEVQFMAASSNFETLLVKASDSPMLYVYQYIWADNTKVQSAWSSWLLDLDIRHAFFANEKIYVIGVIGSAYMIYRLSLDRPDSEGVGFPVFMDGRFDVVGVNKQFALPFAFLESDYVVVQGLGCPNPGMTVKVMSKGNVPGTGFVYTLKHDMQGGRIIVGKRFKSKYTPNQAMIKDSDGVVIGTAKLIHRNFLVSTVGTADCHATVRTKWGTTEDVAYEGRIISDLENKIGVVASEDERFNIPVREQADRVDVDIYTDSVYPMTVLDIEWQGQYNKKGRRMSVAGKAG